MLDLKNPFHDNDGLNLTSLIDIIFILLIFFMISTNFKKHTLPLDLPQSDSVENQQESIHVLSVNETEIQLDGESISLEEIKGRLILLHQKDPEITISLECEKSLPFERVLQVISQVKLAGISRLGIVHDTVK